MQIYLAHNVPVCRHIPRAAYTPPLQATGPCAANTKTTPAKLRRGGVKTPPYGFTEIANKIVNTNSRQVVGAACRPPVQFYLAVNARCCISVPAPCRAGAGPRRAVLGDPQLPCLPGRTPARSRHAPYKSTEFANKNGKSQIPVRPPAQFYLAVNARCCIRVPAPYKSTEFANKNGKLQIPVRP